MNRNAVEAMGRAGAGVVEEKGDYSMVRVLGHIPMYVHNQDESVAPCLKRDGFWESWITSWVLNQLSEDMWFIDIGANTGYYSLIARRKVDRVMAFEPNPVYVKMLRESINIGWDQSRGDWEAPGHFNVYEWALSNKTGTAMLSIPSALHGSASLTPLDAKWEPTALKVLTTTLDKALSGIPAQNMLIKIDAEGAEELIWQGMQTTLYRHKPVLMMEYTPGSYSDDFISNLSKYGTIAWINFDGVEEGISVSDIEANNDWLMLVIRPKDTNG